MATTTPSQGFPVPEITDDPNIVEDLTNLALAIERRVVGVYTTAADRNSRITSPQDGQFAFLRDSDIFTVYDGTEWVQYPPVGPAITSGTSVPPNSSGNNGDIFFKV